MENAVIVIESYVITTIVYAFLVPIFFEMDNAFGEREYFVVSENNNESDKTMTMTPNTQQKVVILFRIFN